MLSGLPVIYGVSPYTESTTPKHELGTLGYSRDGRKFRYCKAGGVALVAGNVIQSPAEVTAQESIAVASNAAIGATKVTVTTGATVTADAYAGGFMVVTNTPGNGTYYKIKKHPATSGAASCVITLYQPLIVALTSAASKVDLVFDPYNGVIQNPATSNTGGVVGVALKALSASSYGWIQTGGICSLLAGDTCTVGGVMVAKQGTAASAITGVHATTEAYPILGRAMTSGTSGENFAVYLTLD